MHRSGTGTRRQVAAVPGVGAPGKGGGGEHRAPTPLGGGETPRLHGWVGGWMGGRGWARSLPAGRAALPAGSAALCSTPRPAGLGPLLLHLLLLLVSFPPPQPSGTEFPLQPPDGSRQRHAAGQLSHTVRSAGLRERRAERGQTFGAGAAGAGPPGGGGPAAGRGGCGPAPLVRCGRCPRALLPCGREFFYYDYFKSLLFVMNILMCVNVIVLLFFFPSSLFNFYLLSALFV